MYIKGNGYLNLLFKIAFILLLAPNPIFAQEKTIINTNVSYDNIDYLKKQNAAADIAYIHQLIDAGNNKLLTNPDSALILYRAALDKSLQIEYSEAITRSFINLAAYYNGVRDYTQSIEMSHLALKYNNEIEGKEKLALENRSFIYYNIASSYYTIGQYGIAAYYFYKNIDVLRNYTPKNSNIVSGTYIGLAAIWARLNQQEQAKDYYNMGEDIARRNNDSSDLITILSNRAMVYFDQNDKGKAKEYLLQALSIANIITPAKIRSGNTEAIRDAIISANLNLGRIYIDEHNPEQALSYTWTGMNLGKQQKNVHKEIYAYLLLGYIYYQLNDYNKAEQYLLVGAQKALATGVTDNLMNAHELLAEIYASKEMFQKAFKHQKAYSSIKDSISGQNHAGIINQLEVQSKVGKKDKELMQKQLMILRQKSFLKEKNIWITCISITAFLLSVISFIIFKNNRHRQSLQAEKILNLQQEQEISELKARMKGEEEERVRIARELHDGIVSQLSAVKMNFNAMPNQTPELNNTTDYQDALEQLEESINELRITAHNLMPEILLQGGILEAVHIFCEKINKSNDIYIEFQTYGVIPPLEQNFELYIYRIVQELVHNIIKHAEATHGLVQISCKDTMFTVTVEDNGKGIDHAYMSGGGVGLSNLRARIQALKGYLDISSHADTGTAIYLEFDITSNNKTNPLCI